MNILVTVVYVTSKPVCWTLSSEVITSFTTFDFGVYGAGGVLPQKVFVSNSFISNVSWQDDSPRNG